MAEVDEIREASALMRERAEAATPGPWSRENDDLWMVANGTLTGLTASHDVTADGEYIASWHPAVALVVADWLDRVATDFDQWHGTRAACRDLDQSGEEDESGRRCECAYKDCYEHGKWHNCTHGEPDITPALAVARVYLGGEQE